MSEDASEIGMGATEQETELLQFRIPDLEAGARLDAYLAAKISERSRSSIQRLIEDGDVLVNDRAAKSSYKLRAGDRVEVELAPPPPTSFTPENIPLDIVYEDDAIVVVNKPAGMVVHPAAGVHSGTLANALAFRLRNADVPIAECGMRNADLRKHGGSIRNPKSAFRNRKASAFANVPE